MMIETVETAIDHENTKRALTGEPTAKVCIQCVHYRKNYTSPICSRDLHIDFNPVTGKTEEIGDTHYCENERELKHERTLSVEDLTACGAIGQFFEKKKEEKVKWYKRLGDFMPPY